MSEVKQKQRVYLFDANVFITLNRAAETLIPIPDSVWDMLDKLMLEGKIISHRAVYDEVVVHSPKPDKVSGWLIGRKAYFLIENQKQVEYMIEATREFPKLVKVESEKEDADPWLVAMAREMNELNSTIEHVVVTLENTRSTTNLSAACDFFGVQHITVREFFDENNISLNLAQD